jgi:hypothetical protein
MAAFLWQRVLKFDIGRWTSMANGWRPRRHARTLEVAQLSGVVRFDAAQNDRSVPRPDVLRSRQDDGLFLLLFAKADTSTARTRADRICALAIGKSATHASSELHRSNKSDGRQKRKKKQTWIE